MTEAAIVDTIRNQLAAGVSPTTDQAQALLATIDALQAELQSAQETAAQARLEQNTYQALIAAHQALVSTHTRDSIEHQRTTEALLSSEERFRALFDGAAIGIALTDLAGRIVDTNPALQRLLGYSEAELSRQDVMALAYHDDRDLDRAQMESLLDGQQEHYQIEKRYLRRDGTVLWSLQTVSAICEAPGQPQLVIVMIENITERKKMQEALLESEGRYRVIAELTSDYAYSMRRAPDGRFVREWVTDAFTRITGYTLEEFDALGNWASLVHPDDMAIVQVHEQAVLAGGRDETQFRIITKAGEVRWLYEFGYPVWDAAQQRVIRIFGAASDITERKHAEDALHFLAHASKIFNASLDYETTLEQVARLSVPFLAESCLIDLIEDDRSVRRLVIAHADPDKEQLLRQMSERYPIDAQWPLPIAQVLQNQNSLLIADVSHTLLQDVARDEEQLRLLKQLHLQSAIIVPLTARSRVLGTMIFFSEKPSQQYDAEDLALAEELGVRAGMAVDNARLYREARAAVEARDEFLSIAAHELKTPTAALISATYLLQRWIAQEQPPPSERFKRELLVIDLASRRLNNLIDELTEFAQIQTGRFSIERRPVVLVELARHVLEQLQPTSRHYVQLICPDESLTVEGDAARLARALHNLAQNAIKYSPRGGIVTVRVVRQGDDALISVSDQGIGVPDAAQPQLFQRFYRASNAVQQNIGGMGIGLYLVKEIVTHHGGQVEVRSREGFGSTFTMRLPLHSPPE
ncbi:MAG TPA: PAS domain S-box protein [Herpetosiphonaceae bacterium]